MMSIVLVSSNPLFAEVLCITLQEAAGASVIQVDPDKAPDCIRATRPAVIVVDESRTGAVALSEVLAVTRSLPGSRTILVNLQNNDITIVTAQRATIQKVEDMMKVIEVVEAEQRNGSGGELETASPAAAARARAGAYGFLALLCNQRPDRNLVQRLRAVGVGGFLGMVDPEARVGLVGQGLQAMAVFVEQAAVQADDEVETMLAVDWTRLFRGVRPGYGPPPPYESVYVGSDPLAAMESVAEVYRQLGVVPAEGSGSNRPDYIGMELDFLRYLCEQQAAVYEQGEEEVFEQWSRAEEAFLQDHLGKWAPAFCDRAGSEARTGFYAGALLLIKGMLEEMSDVQPVLSLGGERSSRRT